ncbi:MAG: alpha/beta hydrolase, partial [Candidatus Promineifilaceae bacterium]
VSTAADVVAALNAGAGPHPTAVLIHGRSGDEDVMWIFERAIPANWLVVAPRAILAAADGGYSWHPQAQEWPALAAFEPAAAALAGFVGALPALYAADPERVTLIGFSQGAAAAFAAVMATPGLARAIASLVGFLPEDGEPAGAANLSGLPVFMAAGARDPRIPLARAHAAADRLRRLGTELEYQAYQTEHRLNAKGMRDLRAWLARR